MALTENSGQWRAIRAMRFFDHIALTSLGQYAPFCSLTRTFEKIANVRAIRAIGSQTSTRPTNPRYCPEKM